MYFKASLTFLLLVLGQMVQANMSSPIRHGTMTSSAFTSKDIHILSEFIHITIDKDFKTAKFVVEYTVQSEVAGRQIPLLFYAQDYKDSFYVWVNQQPVAIQAIPSEYTHFNNSPFSGFSRLTENEGEPRTSDEVTIYWQESTGYVYPIYELKYFETDLPEGVHKVRVEYTANAWIDVSGWIKSHSFRYSLTPAKFWKSFGRLDIVVEQEGTVKTLTTNLGEPKEQSFQKQNSWTFQSLPGEYLEFSYTPEISPLAQALIAISPFGLACMAGGICLILHLLLINLYRKNNIHSRFSPVVIAGSILIPFLVLLCYILSFSLIDRIIGENAGNHHGYVFLVMLFYPILLPVYWTLMWLFDRWQKRLAMNK